MNASHLFIYALITYVLKKHHCVEEIDLSLLFSFFWNFILHFIGMMILQ